MKIKFINRLLLLMFFVTVGLTSCDGGKSDTDGNKDIEGNADPANTGGKLGGSQSEVERANGTDTVNTTNEINH
jgi:hypothetical protein